MEDRVIRLEGVRNLRDFGGYQGLDGKRVKSGALFRSGHYAEATDDDISRLETLNIVVQADLRRPDERERQVNRWPGEAVRVISHDGGREMQAPHARFLQETEVSAQAAESWMVEYYKSAPFRPHHVDLFTAWFNALAELPEDSAALVNCAAGKDRTGILCALTHHALGVGDNDIYTDYDLTNTAANVDARLPEARAYFNDILGKDYDAEVYRPFIGVRIPYLETAFEAIDKAHGNRDDYLASVLGVDDTKRERILSRLLADDLPRTS